MGFYYTNEKYFDMFFFAQVSGWGRTEDGTPSDILQSAELTFVETNDCINKFPHSLKRYITPDKFCGETKAGRGERLFVVVGTLLT